MGVVGDRLCTWPGHAAWYQTGSTKDAFYSLNFFSHLGVRTAATLVMAAVVSLVEASRIIELSLWFQLAQPPEPG